MHLYFKPLYYITVSVFYKKQGFSVLLYLLTARSMRIVFHKKVIEDALKEASAMMNMSPFS